MIELIADDGILSGKYRFEKAAVGIKAGGIEYGVLRAEERADLLLQLLMDIEGSADKTNACASVAAAPI